MRRLTALGLLGGVVVAGLVVHLVLPETLATDVAGDVLYAVAVYLALVSIAPRLPPLAVAAITLGWGVTIELLQLTSMPVRIAEVFRPAVLVLGTAFDPRDLVIAIIVPIALAVVDVVVLSRYGDGLRLVAGGRTARSRAFRGTPD